MKGIGLFDDVPLIWLVAAGVAALVGSLFAAADTALSSLSASRIGALLDQASTATRPTWELIQRDGHKLRSRYLLGRLVATVLVTGLLIGALGPQFPDRTGLYLALGCAVLGMGLLFEVSTALARRYADAAAPILTRWLRPLELVMLPLTAPLGLFGQLLSRESTEDPNPRVTEAEVEMMVDQVERSGLVDREPAEMIRNMLEFSDLTARDVMIPRSRIEAIELSTPVAAVVALVTESGHSRYPVYDKELDNVVGLLYAKDLFKAIQEAGPGETSTAKIMRVRANFVAESQPLPALMREMRSRSQHLAIVVDELGSMVGIVTLEDVLEEIVGEIRDEHDEAEPEAITDLGDGRLVVDADVTMRELSEYLGAELPSARHESLGGMLTHHAGEIPRVGTTISKYGLRFIVRDSSDDRVGKVEITRSA
jgi:CBS domain containing-hemolysin-like protein